MAAESRLATKVESFRTRKESIKAQYSAAEAQVRITESVTGISEEMADVGMAVQKAEEKTENMKARSAALDDLLESGTLTDYTGGDELGREIETLVNEQLHAGTYEVDWNASNYPSGVYFYTMRTEGYTETKRMILIK